MALAGQLSGLLHVSGEPSYRLAGQLSDMHMSGEPSYRPAGQLSELHVSGEPPAYYSPDMKAVRSEGVR
jgi:hypothetical protein